MLSVFVSAKKLLAARTSFESFQFSGLAAGMNIIGSLSITIFYELKFYPPIEN